MFFCLKNKRFLAVFALGQADCVKNTHASCVKNTQSKRLAKHKKTAVLSDGGLSKYVAWPTRHLRRPQVQPDKSRSPQPKIPWPISRHWPYP